MSEKPPLLSRVRLYFASRIDRIARRLLLLGLKAGWLERHDDAAQERGEAGRSEIGKAP
jgi:hypothetical protein